MWYLESTGLKVFGEGEWKVRQHGLQEGFCAKGLLMTLYLLYHSDMGPLNLNKKLKRVAITINIYVLHEFITSNGKNVLDGLILKGYSEFKMYTPTHTNKIN